MKVLLTGGSGDLGRTRELFGWQTSPALPPSDGVTRIPGHLRHHLAKFIRLVTRAAQNRRPSPRPTSLSS